MVNGADSWHCALSLTFLSPLNAHTESSSGGVLMSAELTVMTSDWWIRIVSNNVFSCKGLDDPESLSYAIIYHEDTKTKGKHCFIFRTMRWYPSLNVLFHVDLCDFMRTSCLYCELHFHRGLHSSDRCRCVCSTRLYICCVIVSLTIVSCNRTDTHTVVSLRVPPPPRPPIPPGIAVGGMARCLGMQHAISLAQPLAVGLRAGTLPTGPPTIIVVVHSMDASRCVFPPVHWEPEVRLQLPPYVTQIRNTPSLCWDRWVFITIVLVELLIFVCSPDMSAQLFSNAQ